MLRHAIAPAKFFSQTPNDLIRHPRLSSCAVRLLQWALSLPDGSRETLGGIGEKLSEGRTTVRRARAQLEAEGYVHTRRSQDPATGRWRTRVLVSNVPLTDEREIEAAFANAAPPSDRKPTVGEPAARAVGASTKVENTRENTPTPQTPSPRERERGRAAALLARLGDREPRLRLGIAEASRLAPFAAKWLTNGVTEAELHATLTTALPPRVHAPAAFLTYRLRGTVPMTPKPSAPHGVPPLPECERCRDPLPRGSKTRLCRRC